MDTLHASWSVPESASEENMSVFYSRPYHKVVCAREGGERERARERESKREREREREQEREREREKAQGQKMGLYAWCRMEWRASEWRAGTTTDSLAHCT